MNLRVIFAIVLLAVGGLLSACPRRGNGGLSILAPSVIRKVNMGRLTKALRSFVPVFRVRIGARWRAP